MHVLRKSQVYSARGAVNDIDLKASGMLPVDDSRMVSGVSLTKRSVRDEQRRNSEEISNRKRNCESL